MQVGRYPRPHAQEVRAQGRRRVHRRQPLQRHHGQHRGEQVDQQRENNANNVSFLSVPLASAASATGTRLPVPPSAAWFGGTRATAHGGAS
ncbi:MAG: hypothetical protein NVSMB65_02790 [Chloroflexota bacterium]